MMTDKDRAGCLGFMLLGVIGCGIGLLCHWSVGVGYAGGVVTAFVLGAIMSD